MEPTPVLKEYFDKLHSGKAFVKNYYSQPEDFQRFMRLLANASDETLRRLTELLEQKEAEV